MSGNWIECGQSADVVLINFQRMREPLKTEEKLVALTIVRLGHCTAFSASSGSNAAKIWLLLSSFFSFAYFSLSIAYSRVLVAASNFVPCTTSLTQYCSPAVVLSVLWMPSFFWESKHHNFALRALFFLSPAIFFFARPLRALFRCWLIAPYSRSCLAAGAVPNPHLAYDSCPRELLGKE